VSEAWFGLLGVVVGGVISTLWNWLAAVRQELSDAMVAARLVEEELRVMADDDGSGGRTPVSQDVWETYRVPLAKVLGERQWRAVADVYHGSMPRQPTSEETAKAREALRPLVQGKRRVVGQRWRNMASDLVGRG
jgi:hypothetical protein